MSEFLTFAAWAFLGVIAVTATTFLAHSREQWIWLIGVWTLLGTVVFVSVYGVGHYWSIASYVGKLVATAFAICSVVTSASVGVMAGRASGGAIWQVASGLIGGALGIFLGEFLGVLAACSLTGDCP